MTASTLLTEDYGLWSFTAAGTNVLDARPYAGYVRNEAAYTGTDLPGLAKGGDFTIELEAKVLEGTDDDAFVLEYFDNLGGAFVTLGPRAVSALHSSHRYGKSVIRMSTTDAFHRYRLVRSCKTPGAASCLYWHLYVDDDPIPVDVDRHVDGTVLGRSRLSLGTLGYPAAKAKAHVEIKSVKWQRKALAPRLPKP